MPSAELAPAVRPRDMQNLPVVENAFTAFSQGRGELLQREWVKLCVETGLIGGDTNMTVIDIDLIWSRVMPKQSRKMALLEFELALVAVAQRQMVPPVAIFRQVSRSKGPLPATNSSLPATSQVINRGPERFYYDKKSYTGTHVNGGPSNVDAGRGGLVSDLSEVCDRTKADSRGVKEYDFAVARRASALTTGMQRSTISLISTPSQKLSPDRRRSGLQEGLLAEYVQRQQAESDARRQERAMMRSGTDRVLPNSESVAQPLKDTKKKAGSASAVELAPSPTPPEKQTRSRPAPVAPVAQAVESPDRRDRRAPSGFFANPVRMDVGDVDDVESDDDSAEDAEPNPTFESPPRRQPPGQSVGLLDSIARVESALSNFGKGPQDPRQRDDGRVPRHGAFGSATGDRRIFPADLAVSAKAKAESASNTPIDTPPQSQSISSDWERPTFAPPSREINRAPARAPAREPARDSRALRPGPERFFYDKSSYTGTHARGGPDAKATKVTDLKTIVRGGPTTSGGLKPRKADVNQRLEVDRQRSVSPHRATIGAQRRMSGQY